ncbi:DUF1851 domain-containing protein [Empedobacter falsenii]|uniref:T6SS immunity protein Tdi1 domain-containing protein n=1 Tax=Empedobacter falsenii TaxID=343874 RepID=UPI0025774F61|nr:T6SS immunity protein Tdi1 domain-containing protein [Empedobacter falsenii]MDM1299479.1 DUF1851 domain-containing protein [Empedobacter falsenii]MDM1319271.1 DUF1851 domain-containing protein [Empedobacter falsenii]
MLSTINENWKWKGVNVIKIIDQNDFGNIIFQNIDNSVWRIYPEELECIKIAINLEDFNSLKLDNDFIIDWNFEHLVNKCKEEIGNFELNEKYYLIIPAILGVKYETPNIRKISFEELISISADLAFQVNNLADGQKIIFKTLNK